MQRGFLIAAVLAVSALLVGAQTDQEPPRKTPSPPPAAPAKPAAQGPRTLEEAERLFLEGKLSARELQPFLAARLHSAGTEGVATNATPDKALEVLRTSDPDPDKNPPPGPAVSAEQLPGLGRDGAEPVGDDFAEIEARMEELLRKKRERDRQMSNRLSRPLLVPGKEMSRRERLDALLRLYIEGELSQEEYQKRREAVILGREEVER